MHETYISTFQSLAELDNLKVETRSINFILSNVMNADYLLLQQH